MNKIQLRIRTVCLAAIAIIIAADIMAFSAFLFLDNMGEHNEQILYKNVKVTEVRERLGSELVCGKRGSQSFMVDTATGLCKVGDVVNVVETDTVTRFTNHIKKKKFKIEKTC